MIAESSSCASVMTPAITSKAALTGGAALLGSPVLVVGVAAGAIGIAATVIHETHCRYKLEEATKRINSEESIKKHELDLQSQERLFRDNPELYTLKEEKMHTREIERMRLVHLAEEREKDRQLLRELAHLNVAGVTMNRAIDRFFESFSDPSSDIGTSQA